MSYASKPRLIVILGPTAGGKSELAVALAERLGGEVIGADSMQVYRGMDAGTAKPPPDMRDRVRHHLIDIVDPTQRFTVADWLGLAEPIIDGLLVAGRWPVVVGGTNLYLKALLEGLFAGPAGDPRKRAALAQLPNEALHERLAEVDPASAARIHPNDRKKLVRAIEVYEATGMPISAAQTQWGQAGDREQGAGHREMYRRNPVLIGLDWSVEAINRRINSRVKQMFFPTPSPGNCEPAPGSLTTPDPRSPIPESLPNEVYRLEATDMLGPLGSQAREALGYKQVLQALRGEMTMDEAFEQTKVQTRRFAKRQRTWLKRFRGVHWLAAEGKGGGALAEEASEWIASGRDAEV